MRIIPAIDIIDGKCVRLSQGDYKRKETYHDDPVEVAKSFEDAGIRYLHLVDLDGARSKHIINWRVLEKIASKTKLIIDFGGGIKSDEDIRVAFGSGASQVTGGSIAIENRDLFLEWLKKYGSESIILGADARDGKITTHGWKRQSSTDLLAFVKEYSKAGVTYVICTDVAKDGMLEGPSFETYETLMEKQPGLKLIASGGISCMDELYRLREMGLDGTIVGKAIYEGKITLKELSKLC
jgi:phosphoribosylformimino-5-aminoimidazole carboxamide ribotide isomerase